MKRLIMFTLITLLCLVGCSNESSITTKITLTPIDLFAGEAQKFKPFIGMMSGAFKLNYKGNKPNVILNVDIWKHGSKVKSIGSIHDLYFSTDDKDIHEVEIIVSMELINTGEQEDIMLVKVSNNTRQGYTFTTFSAPWDKKFSARGLIKHHEPMQFTNEQPFHVFGMQSTSENKIYTADFSTESLNRLEQAIILTLAFEEPLNN